MFTNFENMSIQTDRAMKFFFQTQGITLKNRNRLKKYLADVIKKERMHLGYINYIFCSDKYLLGINKQYLGHDYYTDIVTFNLSKDKKSIEAEIYISADRVRENAKSLGISFRQEIHRVMIHGLLHLCGYNDKRVSEKLEMRTKEDYYLAGYADM
jgi:rRNA maturation RNase YbeY